MTASRCILRAVLLLCAVALHLAPPSLRAQDGAQAPKLFESRDYYDPGTKRQLKRYYTFYYGPKQNGRETRVRHGMELLYYDNGQKMRGAYYRNGAAHGDFQAWSRTGVVTIKGAYRDGRKHGIFEYFYPDGTPKMVLAFEDGRRHGTLQVFDTDGRKRIEMSYLKGKKQGLARRWHANQQIAESVAFINDEKDGVERQLRYDGKVEYECTWSHGRKSGAEVYYHPVDDYREFVFNWENGRRHGPSVEFSAAGRQRLLITFHQDRVHGPVKVWDDEGVLLSDGVYRSNKPWDGHFKEAGSLPGYRFENTYRNGELVDGTLFKDDLPFSGDYIDEWAPNRPKRVTAYVNGKIEGSEVTYYMDGTKESEGNWTNNRLNGLYTEWFDDGQKRWEVAVRNGRKDGPEAVWSARGLPIAYGENRAGKPWKGYIPVYVTYNDQKEGGWAIQNYLNGALAPSNYRHPDLKPPPPDGDVDLNIRPLHLPEAGGRGAGPSFNAQRTVDSSDMPQLPEENATGWSEMELQPDEEATQD